MEQIAWIVGHTCIYWSAVVRVLAVAAAVFSFLALYLKDGDSILETSVCVPMATALSLVLARLCHWYFRPDGYAGLSLTEFVFSPGGFALMGVFGGCILTALLLHGIGLVENLPRMLDCMSLGGSLGIALGRLASFFNTSDRGMVLTGNGGLTWADTVVNPVSGQGECRLATFLLQSAAVGVIFFVLLAVYLWGRWKKNGRDGDIFFLFALLYGSTQVVLDSTRYDALYFRSNGFVSVVQVLSALAIVLTAIRFSAGMVRKRGWQKWYPLLWLGQTTCLVLAGYMEYYVQRHGAQALLAYSIMAAALTENLLLTLATRHLEMTTKGEKSNGNHDCKPSGI